MHFHHPFAKTVSLHSPVLKLPSTNTVNQPNSITHRNKFNLVSRIKPSEGGTLVIEVAISVSRKIVDFLGKGHLPMELILLEVEVDTFKIFSGPLAV